SLVPLSSRTSVSLCCKSVLKDDRPMNTPCGPKELCFQTRGLVSMSPALQPLTIRPGPDGPLTSPPCN
ncbi:hypothetical protein KUCAC02_010316, partial [Chaenocephalus aceratus]